MHYPKFSLKQNTNFLLKLTSIFSILFVTMISVAFTITEYEGNITLKSISSTPITTSEPELTTV